MRPEIAAPSVVFSATSVDFSHWSVWIFHSRQCGFSAPKEREELQEEAREANRPSRSLGQVCPSLISITETGSPIVIRQGHAGLRGVSAGASCPLASW